MAYGLKACSCHPLNKLSRIYKLCIFGVVHLPNVTLAKSASGAYLESFKGYDLLDHLKNPGGGTHI